MPVGPGVYDEVATKAREATQAVGVVLIVFGGAKGSGFSVQCDLATLRGLPSVLRLCADEIERNGIGGQA